MPFGRWTRTSATCLIATMKKLAFALSMFAIPVCFVACGGSDDPENAAAGSGGASAGSAGTSAGSGGTAAGSGGTSAGTGGTGGGSGGASAGAGGSEAGSGGTSAGNGGASTGGTAGAGGVAAGAGGSAGTSGGSGGSGGASTPKTTSAMCGSVPILGQQGFDTNAACSECVETSCCNEGTACGAVADCSPYRLCVAPCTTKACTDACDAMFPTGVTPSGNFATCRNTKCGKACQDFS